VEIVVETNTRIMRSKISGNFVPSRCITNENFETGPAQICADLLEIRIDKKKNQMTMDVNQKYCQSCHLISRNG
jgi:hypothetical protein